MQDNKVMLATLVKNQDSLVITTKCKLRATSDSDPKEYTLKLDFSGCTIHEVLEWAKRDRVIAWQGINRSVMPDNKEPVAVKCEYAAKASGKATPDGLMAQLKKLTPEQQEEFKSKLGM